MEGTCSMGFHVSMPGIHASVSLFTSFWEIILDISEFLSVPMIAEGVETEPQYRALKEMGCGIVQGYYFARPMPAEDFESFLVPE